MSASGSASERVTASRTRATFTSALLLLSLFLSSGCGLAHLSDFQFRTDNRLHFTSPKDRAEVHPPVTITWRMSDFRIAALGSEAPSRNAGYFAIFVDRSPIKPGQAMKSIGNGDPYCEQDPKCPDASYLREHNIFTTTATSYTFPPIPDLLSNQGSVQTHTFTVVLMDTSGHRIGESAWELDLRMPKESL